MITIQNYFDKIKALDFDKFPEEFKESHDFLVKTTQNGKSLKDYHSLSDTKKTIDLYLELLNDYVATQHKKSQAKTPKREMQNKKKNESPTLKPSLKKRVQTPKKAPLKVIKTYSKSVELVSEELRFIKRYLLLHNKAKTAHQIRLFINALQKAITEKRIRKSSDYADAIREIQNSLLVLFNKFKNNESIRVVLPESKLNYYASLVGKEDVMLSVKFLKQYINLQGKLVTNQKVKSFHNRIAKAVNQQVISEKDPYWSEINTMLEKLKVFVQKNKNEGILSIPSKELNGIESKLYKKSNKNLNGFDSPVTDRIVNSIDILNMNFEKFDFQGKWLQFIGKPSRPFTAMVFGKPKYGKSFLCIDFAGYLATNHGKVLYVAKEEGIDETLKQKIYQTRVAHPNLDVVSYLVNDLSVYDFVFLDSVTKLNLSPMDLEKLQNRFPMVSFIYVFQTTKLGLFRGANGYQHDVDIVIEVPEFGKAVQYGRFNQGAEMEIQY